MEVLHDCVAIKVETGRVTGGGLKLPDKMNERTKCGIVTHVGPGRYPDNYQGEDCSNFGGPTFSRAARFPMSVEVGDTVYFYDQVGIEVEVDGVKYYVVHEGDILARIPQVPSHLAAAAKENE